MTTINDVVLIHFENQPLAYARIEAIDPDSKRGWYHVKLLLLQIPLQVVTWILRDIYINGESFTMNGKQMRLERVVCPDQEREAVQLPNEESAQAQGKVISLADLKKK